MQDRWEGCVSVIVPVYNEVDHLEELLQAVLASPVKKDVVIVDDGSTDGTREKLLALPQREDVTIVFHEKKLRQGSFDSHRSRLRTRRIRFDPGFRP